MTCPIDCRIEPPCANGKEGEVNKVELVCVEEIGGAKERGEEEHPLVEEHECDSFQCFPWAFGAFKDDWVAVFSDHFVWIHEEEKCRDGAERHNSSESKIGCSRGAVGVDRVEVDAKDDETAEEATEVEDCPVRVRYRD